MFCILKLNAEFRHRIKLIGPKIKICMTALQKKKTFSLNTLFNVLNKHLKSISDDNTKKSK